MSYICPLCSNLLQLEGRTWRCENNHCFDKAKEGYVNLLPVQKKSSKDPGDNKLMMQARREFLEAGHYQHLSDRVNELFIQYLKSESPTLLDLGCGEGYYTGRLSQACPDMRINGLDISKTAIRLASKRNKSLEFCVASAFDLPFASSNFDAVLRIYAPSAPEELSRVVNENGLLLTVSPGPRHHWFLKTLIYQSPEEHDESDSIIKGFERIHTERLETAMSLSGSRDIENFLNMTPYAWKLTKTQKNELSDSGLECELDFKIQIFKKI
ncbi:23S rRNA (guanine(745)-N(1))-methyltransferase [Shewanella sp. OPT22]|nr:23S rRNA (guanine(745)-N(1))-methyltransferase [Shewanella sp. OPT22]